MSIRIIVDSACDLSREEAKKLQIEMIPLTTRFGEEEYLDGVTMSHEEFFEKLIETDEFPQTSQISPYQYGEMFRQVKEAGDQAVCITLSSKLSGCFQSAVLAAQDYPGIVTVVDSENACIGQQILVLLAVELRKQGNKMEEIARQLEIEKKKICLIALLDTLEYLKRGGRISTAAAFMGNMLSIKPVITLEEGEVKVLGKARGSRNGNNLLTQKVDQEGGINLSKPFCLAYSGLSDQLLQKYIRDSQKLYEGGCSAEQLRICSIGSTIGTHVGPGAIALAFFRN